MGCCGEYLDLWEEITREWRKLHEELNDLCYIPTIIPVTKSRKMRWEGHVAGIGDRLGAYRVLVWKP
jgi:hypothetical protein